MTDNGQNGGDLKILFVDDDPNVLAGLRRMLHAERERWDTSLPSAPKRHWPYWKIATSTSSCPI